MILWREQNWQEVKGYMSFGNLEASVSVCQKWKIKKGSYLSCGGKLVLLLL